MTEASVSAGNHTSDEMMTVTAARCLEDGQVCFVGIGLPSEAAASHWPCGMELIPAR